MSQIVSKVAGSIYIKTNDLEASLKSYAKSKGIKITSLVAENHQQIMSLHPECEMFIAADGAHSRMRQSLLGENSLEEFPLQNIVEVKYKVKGIAQKSNNFKTNQMLTNMVFEYVGREKDGYTPVTLRFFVDNNTYNSIPSATFKAPLKITSPLLPETLKKDIHSYIGNNGNIDSVCEDSGSLTKLTLSLYSAKKFSIKIGHQAWFLVGDAAMGVPYFRALNCGLILGSRLAQILASQNFPINNNLNQKMFFYNIHRPLHITTEFAIARGKDLALKSYDMFRKVSNKLPLPFKELSSITDQEIIEKYNQNIAYSCFEENDIENKE